MISCVVVFDCQQLELLMTTHTSTVTDARILREIYRQSDRDRGVEKFISKLRNRHKNGKIDLSCISV